MNLYGYAAGDPVNNSDPFGLWVPMPWCLLALPGGGAIATSGGGAGSTVLGGALAGAAPGAAVGMLGVAAEFMLRPAFPGDREALSRSTSGTWAAEATIVYSRAEGKQIRAAIKTATGSTATNGQYNCMSQHIHECKEAGDGGSKNDKGDFTWDELVQMARDLFTKP